MSEKTKEELQDMLSRIQNRGMTAQTVLKQRVSMDIEANTLVHEMFFDWLQELEFWDE